MKLTLFLSRLMNIAASIILAAMMLLTVSDVFLRYVFRKPILGTTEITESMMACLASFALAWCAAQNNHLKVDLVMSLFSARVQAVMDALTCLIGLVVVALIAWRNFLEAIAVREFNIVSSLVKIPSFPFYYIISLGCGILCLVMVFQVIDNICEAVSS